MTDSRNLNLNSMQEGVEKFMRACGQEVRPFPLLVDDETRALRIRLMKEELLEKGELVDSMLRGDIIGIADGIADLLYVTIGTAAAYGINIQTIFDEVQRSNMTKAILDEETGEYHVIRDEGGKILKPDTFSPADIAPIIFEQIRDGVNWRGTASVESKIVEAEIVEE